MSWTPTKNSYLLGAALLLLASPLFGQSYNFNISGLKFSSGASTPTSCAQDGGFYFVTKKNNLLKTPSR